MGIPGVKTIKERLGVEGKDATIIRQAMEWAETGVAKPTLERYYEEVYYPSHGQGFDEHHTLDYHRFGDVYLALKSIDDVLDNFGVEYVQSNEDTYHRAEGLEYSNTGDSYATTVIYDHGKGRWYITTWGDIVEADDARFGEANNRFFREEQERLDRWADDMVLAVEKALSDTKAQLKALKRQARQATTTDEQHTLQMQIRELERKQRRQRHEIFDAEDEIQDKRDALINALERRLKQSTSADTLFTIRWSVT